MLYIYPIFAMLFLMLALMNLKRDDRDGTVIFHTVVSSIFISLTLSELINTIKGII